MVNRVRVAVNGYGVIGKRVADAIAKQPDMALIGVSDVNTDYRIQGAIRRGYPLFASTVDAQQAMRDMGLPVHGTLEDLLGQVDVVVDCTPKHIGARNKAIYEKAGVKWIVQGGEKHELTGVSFVAQANYREALGKTAARVVSCNTTALCRVLGPLHSRGWVKKARMVLMRRATDPWESHLNGMINTAVPEEVIPSHQGPDAQTIIPDLRLSVVAAAAPFNLGHLHAAFVELDGEPDPAHVMQALHEAPRIAMVQVGQGVEGLNSVIEIARDLERPRNDLWEVALWHDVTTLTDGDLHLVYQVHNESIVVPENIDAIRALTGIEEDPMASIHKTDQALGLTKDLLLRPEVLKVSPFAPERALGDAWQGPAHERQS